MAPICLAITTLWHACVCGLTTDIDFKSQFSDLYIFWGVGGEVNNDIFGIDSALV